MLLPTSAREAAPITSMQPSATSISAIEKPAWRFLFCELMIVLDVGSSLPGLPEVAARVVIEITHRYEIASLAAGVLVLQRYLHSFEAVTQFGDNNFTRTTAHRPAGLHHTG